MKSYDEFVKIAKTRLKKEVEAGNIKNKRIIQKFYNYTPKVEDNINTRINARAKRAADAAAKKAKQSSMDTIHAVRDAKGALKQLSQEPKTPKILQKIQEKTQALKAGKKSIGKTLHETTSRASLADVGKGPMTVDKYKKWSKPDNLRSRPMIDSSRGAMKRRGHLNGRMTSIINRITPGGMKVGHMMYGSQDHGSTSNAHIRTYQDISGQRRIL